MSRRISDLHKFADRLAALLKDNVPEPKSSPCCQGCFSCCYEPVLAYKKEALHAFQAVPAEHAEWVADKATEWAEAFVKSTLFTKTETDVIEYRRERLACPMLRDGKCVVYKARPMACRLHIAVGPAENCHNDELRKTQQFASSPEGLTMVGVAALEACHGKVNMDHFGLFIAEFVTGIEVKSGARIVNDIVDKPSRVR